MPLPTRCPAALDLLAPLARHFAADLFQTEAPPASQPPVADDCTVLMRAAQGRDEKVTAKLAAAAHRVATADVDFDEKMKVTTS